MYQALPILLHWIYAECSEMECTRRNQFRYTVFMLNERKWNVPGVTHSVTLHLC